MWWGRCIHPSMMGLHPFCQPLAMPSVADLAHRVFTTSPQHDSSDVIPFSEALRNPLHCTATQAIGNLACEAQLRRRIAASAMPVLVASLKDQEPECRSNAAGALVNLADSEELRKWIAAAALPALVIMLNDDQVVAPAS